MTRLDILWILLMVEGFFAAGSGNYPALYDICSLQGKLLTVKGGCGNTVISLEPKQLTKKQRFGFLDGTHITSKCDPNSIVGLADNNETLTIKKNDPADYTKNKILLRHLYIPGL
ncbi:uncharacterized protein LOC132696834 isoform X1 [Cylas formicarius]|uniref:uncharacterized protein LOC132696834 isoform X1 n=1 Tax=Cylas formicarius TaxID=197179 RepID=UPI0029588E9A|nr:uncharacterized protein LOC132696834 isoform X1 [Cylas formicarius]